MRNAMQIRVGRPATVVGLAALGIACSDSRPSSWSAVRDSSGVTIVESTAPAWAEGEGFTVDATPVLDLTTTGVSEFHEFYRVSDATMLSDGSIAVTEGNSRLRYYSSTGEYLGAFGRQGEGPGEFQRLLKIQRLPGDTLLAYDRSNVRVTKIGPNREMVGATPLMQMVSGAYALEPGVLLAELAGAEPTPTEKGHQRWPRRYVRVTEDGTVIHTVAAGRGPESVSLEGGTMDVIPFFGKDTYVTVHEGRFYLGDADSVEVRTFQPDGQLERIVRIRGFDLRMPDAGIQAEKDLRVEINARNREINEMLPVPTHRPAYSAIIVDPAGYVWTSESKGRFVSRLGDSPTEWLVFAPDGTWLGRVVVPGRFEVYEIGRDYVLGLHRDAIDLERPQLLRLNR
jgi:hypothetical protein